MEFSDLKLSTSAPESVEPCANRPDRDFLVRLSEWNSFSTNPSDKASVTEAALAISITLVLKWKVQPVR